MLKHETISMHNDSVFALQARWVLPVTSPPIENGIVEITAGKISAVHNKKDSHAKQLGNVAIIPGLVNAHTHLELSDVAQPLQPSTPFASWIRAVIHHRQERTASTSVITNEGHQECTQTGTTLLGDIVSDKLTVAAYQPAGTKVIAFRELIGLLPVQAAAQLEQARSFLQENQPAANVWCGLSPHAPYSVHQHLVQQLSELAEEQNVPVAMHLAETVEELELLTRGSGPLQQFLESMGIWKADLIPQRTRILNYLQLLATAPRVLVVHGNYLDDEEITYLANHSQFTTIYCPRTHAFFSHTAHPWLRLLQQGAAVAIGTDSRASNPDLNLWAELIFLRQQHPEVSPTLLLELGTLAGARAVGMEHATGSLTVGKSADIAVVKLPEANVSDPYTILFSSQTSITATMFSGRWVGDVR